MLSFHPLPPPHKNKIVLANETVISFTFFNLMTTDIVNPYKDGSVAD